MAENRCEQCGEQLPANALTCWACGTLTPAGRRARAAAGDDEETWRRAVEAARRRQAQRGGLDPDEALRRVLAQTGGQVTPPSAWRPELFVALPRIRERVTEAADLLASLSALLALLTALGGLLAAVAGIVAGKMLALLSGLAAFVAIGGLSLAIYFQGKFLAELGQATSATLTELMRLQTTLEEERARPPSAEPTAAHEGGAGTEGASAGGEAEPTEPPR